jgi:hypothetical protein
VCCSLRPARVTPDVVALRCDAADDRFRLEGSGQRILCAQLKLSSEEPAIRAAAPRNSSSGFVVRNREKILVAALEEVRGSHIAMHGRAFFRAYGGAAICGCLRGGIRAPVSATNMSVVKESTGKLCWCELSESTSVALSAHHGCKSLNVDGSKHESGRERRGLSAAGSSLLRSAGT